MLCMMLGCLAGLLVDFLVLVLIPWGVKFIIELRDYSIDITFPDVRKKRGKTNETNGRK